MILSTSPKATKPKMNSIPASPTPTLLLLTLYPPPPPLLFFYTLFRATLQALLTSANVPTAAYTLYDPSMLHCTVATLYPSYAGPLQDGQGALAAWRELTMRAGAKYAREHQDLSTMRLTSAKVFHDGTGVLLFNDVNGAVTAMRICSCAELQSVFGESRLHVRHVKIPSIVHCTVLRWRERPVVGMQKMQEMFNEAFREAGGGFWVGVEEFRLVAETVPYMREHVSYGAVWDGKEGVQSVGSEL